ncbi:ATP synthase F(0) complex subunit g, mitochondrial-like [Lycorma delicatula]|uniref:ATP synthase F(0) complex subunit g, mitochondrial-like n=1 Tax=Lycorma delicatula TaxID=130591 RepID=UPI003F5112F2
MAGKNFAGLIKAAKPRWELFLKYAKVELTPPKPNEFGQVREGFSNLIGGFQTGRWKQLTVKEAWLNTLVATEVVMWFFLGEVIGKRHIAGYKWPSH